MQAGMQSPLGPISLTEADGAIIALQWQVGPAAVSPLLAEAIRQLTAYFDRRLTKFDLPLAFGSGFAEQVRRAMAAIPYGETRRYGDIAKEIGAPAQAIGQVCSANPIPVLIPCHRILAANGLGGFSAKGGVESKVFLLKLEGAASLLI